MTMLTLEIICKNWAILHVSCTINIQAKINSNKVAKYIKNGQNDVDGLIRVKAQGGATNVDDRTLVAIYSYEPYGEIFSVTNYAGETIGNLNPLRYRSYYRLSTRYYDATVGRFINANNLDILNKIKIICGGIDYSPAAPLCC